MKTKICILFLSSHVPTKICAFASLYCDSFISNFLGTQAGSDRKKNDLTTLSSLSSQLTYRKKKRIKAIQSIKKKKSVLRFIFYRNSRLGCRTQSALSLRCFDFVSLFKFLYFVFFFFANDEQERLKNCCRTKIDIYKIILKNFNILLLFMEGLRLVYVWLANIKIFKGKKKTIYFSKLYTNLWIRKRNIRRHKEAFEVGGKE